jgi:hypothetical protein
VQAQQAPHLYAERSDISTRRMRLGECFKVPHGLPQVAVQRGYQRRELAPKLLHTREAPLHILQHTAHA